jgi:CBS domain-containing protein
MRTMTMNTEVGSCCVAEVMGTELFTLTPDTVIASAQRLAFENGIHHLLVLDNGTLTGIICREDLRLASSDSLVGDCMSSPVLCIAPETTLQEAVDIMGANDIDCLPVVTGAFLVGIVTREALEGAGGLESEAGGAADLLACTACGTTDHVRRDPRAGGTPLCVHCQGFMSATQARARFAD